MEEKKSFEEKLCELELIVRQLENGDIPLDDAINQFNDAMILAKECNNTLEEAQGVINKMLNKDGEFDNFEVEE